MSAYDAAITGNQEAINMLGYDPRNLPQVKADQLLANEESYNSIQTNVDMLNKMLSDPTTLNNVTGSVQNVISTFTNWEGMSFAEQVKALSKNVQDGSPVTEGITTGGIDAVNKRNDFLNSAGYIVNNFTFDKLLELKKGGATFGALSDNELRAIGGAASRLGNAARYKDGKIVGFTGSKEQVIEDIKFIQTKFKKTQDALNASVGLTESEKLEIINL